LRFSRPRNSRYEDHIEAFPHISQGVGSGKILSLFKTQKTPIILGWFHTDFLTHLLELLALLTLENMRRTLPYLTVDFSLTFYFLTCYIQPITKQDLIKTVWADLVGTSAENLNAAAAGEHFEWGTLYPDFVQVADRADFPEIAKVFRMISVAETGHKKRFLALLDDIEKGRVFKRDVSVKWRCRNCGYIHEGPEAPRECLT
jgi:rubrerythrin